MQLPDITTVEVKGKRVIVRLDLDVPITKEQRVGDDTRLLAGLTTVAYLLEKGAFVTLIGHLGRPQGSDTQDIKTEDRVYTLLPVAMWFVEKLGLPHESLVSQRVGDFEGWKLSDTLYMAENVRFYTGEISNDSEFSKKLALLGELFVNDAFAVCHRAHASLVGIPLYIPAYAGLQLVKEYEALSYVIEHAESPFVAIIGGKKLETKLPLVERMHSLADYVLVGGKLAGETAALITVSHERIEGKKSVLLIGELNEEKTDITRVSAENFAAIINGAKTIVWNGPLGFIEEEKGQEGTKIVAKAVADSRCYSVVGGGDTIAFLKHIGILDKFRFVSTGGGAMLSFLSGESLPGIEILKKETR